MITNSEMIYTYIKTIEEENLKFKKMNEELHIQTQSLTYDLANLNKQLEEENLKFKKINEELYIQTQTLTHDLANLNKFSIINSAHCLEFKVCKK